MVEDEKWQRWNGGWKMTVTGRRKMRCNGRKDRGWPIFYTNFLVRCLVDSIAVFARDSSALTSITLDGIPLSPKYLNILCSGLKNNEKLMNLSLIRCRIGDVGCDLLLGSLRNSPKVCTLNLSSCRLTNRSAMCLSLFLKRRKADVLQNVWDQSSLQSCERNSNGMPQGLHTLILNRNRKLGDHGVKQLTYALKADSWLKSLSLRDCGITKYGAEMMIRLLQTNNTITKLDLTENRIPINTLQTLLRILKRKREIAENTVLKKRLRFDRRRNVFENDIRGSIKKGGKHFLNGTERFSKYTLHKHRWRRRIQKKVKQTKEMQCVKDKDSYRRKKLCDLETQLLNLIKSNSKLKDELTTNKALLNEEAQQRTKMEDDLQKASLRLNDLRSKVIMLNCLSSKACTESRLLKGLKYIFEKLESFTISKQDDVRQNVLMNTAEPLWSSPLAQGGDCFINCSQRRPYFSTLQITPL
ncbi:Protein Cep78 homolog [Anthophora plagiata]